MRRTFILGELKCSPHDQFRNFWSPQMKSRIVLLGALFISIPSFAQITCGGFNPWPGSSNNSSTVLSTGTNHNQGAAGGITLTGFELPYPEGCITSGVSYVVIIPDNTTKHMYDLGLVYQSGGAGIPGHTYVKLGAMLGSQFAPEEGVITQTWIPTPDCPHIPCAIPFGVYAWAQASNCPDTARCAVLGGDQDLGAIFPFSSQNQGWTFTPTSGVGLPNVFSPLPMITLTSATSGTGRTTTNPKPVSAILTCTIELCPPHK
jgi:hypothetical protein